MDATEDLLDIVRGLPAEAFPHLEQEITRLSATRDFLVAAHRLRQIAPKAEPLSVVVRETPALAERPKPIGRPTKTADTRAVKATPAAGPSASQLKVLAFIGENQPVDISVIHNRLECDGRQTRFLLESPHVKTTPTGYVLTTSGHMVVKAGKNSAPAEVPDVDDDDEDDDD